MAGFVKSEGGVWFMIYCCGRYHVPTKTVIVAPDFLHRDRKLEIIICPVCGSLSACLTQYNIKEQKYETIRPKRKKTAKFIQEVEAGKWSEVKIKYGTKERAGFVYGVNKVLKDGTIKQYAVDFNGTKTLVKVI